MADRDVVQVIPVTAHIQVAGVSYACVAMSVTLTAHAIPTAVCSLAVGTTDGTSRKIDPGAFKHGDEAVVLVRSESAITDPVRGTVFVRAGETVVLRGTIEDAGPGSLAYGTFNFDVIIVGRTAAADEGSMVISYLTPGALGELRALSGPLGGRATGVTHPLIEGSWGENDVWASLSKTFARILEDGALVTTDQQSSALTKLRSSFGDVQNARARAFLKEVKGALAPGVRLRPTLSNLRTYVSALLQDAHKYEGLLSRILDLGYDLLFRMVEHGSGVAVVPFSAFLPSDKHIDVPASGLTRVGWAGQKAAAYRGGAMVANSTLSASGLQQSATNVLGEPFKVPNASHGTVLTVPTPRWSYMQLSNSATGIPGPVETNFAQAYAASYVREMTLEQNYRARSVTVEAPLRFDIGLLAPVKINYGSVGGVQAGAIFGVVQQISIELDTRSKRAAVVWNVSYARSNSRQTVEIDPTYVGHPVWEKVYTGGRLDEHPAAGIE